MIVIAVAWGDDGKGDGGGGGASSRGGSGKNDCGDRGDGLWLLLTLDALSGHCISISSSSLQDEPHTTLIKQHTRKRHHASYLWSRGADQARLI